jgi:hypothetical protein
MQKLQSELDAKKLVVGKNSGVVVWCGGKFRCLSYDSSETCGMQMHVEPSGNNNLCLTSTN